MHESMKGLTEEQREMAAPSTSFLESRRTSEQTTRDCPVPKWAHGPRSVTMPKVTVLHADHGIAPEQQQFVENYLRMFAPPHFFILRIEIPDELGTVPNAMWGPTCGDDPVDEQDVFYGHRGDREWADRFVARTSRPCSYVHAIGIREGDVNDSGNPVGDITLFTVYGGPLAPQHPDDPTNQDPDGAREFWATHALASPHPWCCEPGCPERATHRLWGQGPEESTDACPEHLDELRDSLVGPVEVEDLPEDY